MIYKITAEGSDSWYIGLTKCGKKETFIQAAERRLEEHKASPTSKKMAEWLKDNQVKVEVLHGGRVVSERTLADLETVEIMAHFAGGGTCLNSQKVPKFARDTPAEVAEAVVDFAEHLAARTGGKVERVVKPVAVDDEDVPPLRQPKTIEDYIERGSVKKDEKQERFYVTWYERGRKKHKKFRYARNYDATVKSVLEFLKTVVA